MNTYWISLPCDLLSSLASFQCSLLHHLHLSSDLGLSKYVNQHSHLNLSRNVRLSVLYDLDFNKVHFQTPSKLGSPATPRSMATSEASESDITLTNFKKGIKSSRMKGTTTPSFATSRQLLRHKD